MLVAGGTPKLAALTELTNPEWPGPRPTTLITDVRTADVLLARRYIYNPNQRLTPLV